MGAKIDQLEKSINELIDEAGVEKSNSVANKGSASQKMREDPDTAEF
jgi:hypothetical protein